MTDDHENNLIAAGALYALLSGLTESRHARLTTVELVADREGNATNQIDISLSFMASPYRITVERVLAPEEAVADILERANRTYDDTPWGEALVARLSANKYRVVPTADGHGWFVYSNDTDPSFT